MGVAGWLARRVLAVAIFAPLFGAWYAVFAFLLRLPPGFLGLREQAQGELLITAFVAALISDFLIVRAAKRAMEARSRRTSKG